MAMSDGEFESFKQVGMMMVVGQAALAGLLDRGLHLDTIKYTEPELWEAIILEAGSAAIVAMAKIAKEQKNESRGPDTGDGN